MRFQRRMIVLALTLSISLNLAPPAKACGGARDIEPIFVFKESPDLPFEEFAQGKIGIVLPTFGRKSLFIAYRYLSEQPFTASEQHALVEALRGTPPEDEGGEAIKAWIAARKEFVAEGEDLPAIYTQRESDTYDFFPNCTKNAFEVAGETLRDRSLKYGANDRSVRSWLAAQDVVFENCAGGKRIPDPLGGESPTWLRKDRDYQIGAAYFYSLNFDAARSTFEKIVDDIESPWRETADYLISRTLVRQASLSENEKKRREANEQAEGRLQKALNHGDRFQNASRKLLSLVKYRLHPEERLHELAHLLSYQSADEDLRQDLIDYAWLLDKFEAQVLKEEEKRKRVLKVETNPEASENPNPNANYEVWQAVQKGDLIQIYLVTKLGNGVPDYANTFFDYFKPDVPETEIQQAVEQKLGRKLSPEETNALKEEHRTALQRREWLLAPNQRWGKTGPTEYEGAYSPEKLTMETIPATLSADDLSDWIFTLQISDPQAYAHAVSKLRDTDSTAWLAVALAKAEKDSPDIQRIMRIAEKVSREAAAFPTIAYHLARLQIDQGKTIEARKLLDDVISSRFDSLPISAQNQFLEQRAEVAANLGEFLKFAKRKPVTFLGPSSYGRISELLAIEKTFWNAEENTKEDFERETEESFKELLPWDDRATFDENSAEILNRHFPLTALAEAARDSSLPDYLQRRLILTVWTRAVLLGQEEVSLKYTEDVIKIAPDMAEVFQPFLRAKTKEDRQVAGLWIILKSPLLTPFVKDGVPSRHDDEMGPWEDGWWSDPIRTDYNNKGEPVSRIIPKPAFVSDAQSDQARRELETIKGLGSAPTYLGNQVLDWARREPKDARVPEALYVITEITTPTRYGNGDDEMHAAAEELLRSHYPNSPWTIKLDATDK